jgi:hypothetical protein
MPEPMSGIDNPSNWTVAPGMPPPATPWPTKIIGGLGLLAKPGVV